MQTKSWSDKENNSAGDNVLLSDLAEILGVSMKRVIFSLDMEPLAGLQN